jgi:hypothetical protein
VIIDDIEKELGDYCYEDETGLKIIKGKHCGCKENESTAYLGYEFITEKEFNNSDKWKTLLKQEYVKLLNYQKEIEHVMVGICNSLYSYKLINLKTI